MKLITRVLCVGIFLGSSLMAAPPERNGVELAVLTAENREQFSPNGKAADSDIGDIVLRNHSLTAVIARPGADRHANRTVRDVGGCLIDLTSRAPQSDQLACFSPATVHAPYVSWSFAVDDGTAQTPTAETLATGMTISLTVASREIPGQPYVETTYRLDDSVPWLTVVSRYENRGDQAISFILEDLFLMDATRHEMRAAADGRQDLFWVEDSFWRQAYAVRSISHTLQSRRQMQNFALTYETGRSELTMVLEPGETIEVIRQIACGPTLLHVAANFHEDPSSLRETTLKLEDGLKRSLDHAVAEILRDDVVLGIGRTNREGRLVVPLEQGDYAIRSNRHGVALAPMRFHVGRPERQTHQISFPGYRPGAVSFLVQDESGQRTPCKIQFLGKGETPSPDFGPEASSFGVRNTRYTPDGKFVEDLYPGEYDIIISRGPEFDAVFQSITVEPGRHTPIEQTLKRSVDTTGWISSHLHTRGSAADGAEFSPLGRVLNLACEQIEFAPYPERHRFAMTRRHVDRLGFSTRLKSANGLELLASTAPLTLESLDSQGPWSVHHPATETTGRTPEFGWLVDNSKTPQESHPGAPLALFDSLNLFPIEDRFAGESGDAPEQAGRQSIFKWLQLLNQGARLPAVVNADSPYGHHGVGCLRNWVQSDIDAPEEIRSEEIVRGIEDGQVVMSNGPFLKVLARHGEDDATVTSGGLLSAPDGQVRLEISVQCPNWLDVDAVFVLINGRVRNDLKFTRKDHPDDFDQAAMKFHKTIDLTLPADSHVIVAAGGQNVEVGDVMGPEACRLRPAALTNPVYIDVDGGGFQANQDSLGRPWPSAETEVPEN